jgi:Pyruvate kinase, barrel domain
MTERGALFGRRHARTFAGSYGACRYRAAADLGAATLGRRFQGLSAEAPQLGDHHFRVAPTIASTQYSTHALAALGRAPTREAGRLPRYHHEPWSTGGGRFGRALMKRVHKAKIVATLGPASSSREVIRALFEQGADVFRFNFSHGSHEEHQRRYDIVREIERETNRPIAVLADLQGPKLRVGAFAEGRITLLTGGAFRLDLDETLGDPTRVFMPHPEVFAALAPGVELRFDDGKLRLAVETCGPDFANLRVLTGGPLSDRKGVSVVGPVLPLSPLTEKDRVDLDFALRMGADWVALSFVQRSEDMREKPAARRECARMPGSW